MATAAMRSRAAGQLGRRAEKVGVRGAMQFVIFQDNGGADQCQLDADDGATLARSEGFASYDDAEETAESVGDGAASARLDRRVGEVGPVDLTAHRDELGAERWLVAIALPVPDPGGARS